MRRMPSRLWRSMSQRWAKCTASTARPYRGSKLETSCLEILWRFLVSWGLFLLFPILSWFFLSLSLPFSSFDKTPSVLSLFLCVMRRTRICRDDVCGTIRILHRSPQLESYGHLKVSSNHLPMWSDIIRSGGGLLIFLFFFLLLLPVITTSRCTQNTQTQAVVFLSLPIGLYGCP